jgi:hypothetical protein
VIDTIFILNSTQTRVKFSIQGLLIASRPVLRVEIVSVSGGVTIVDDDSIRGNTYHAFNADRIIPEIPERSSARHLLIRGLVEITDHMREGVNVLRHLEECLGR